MVLAPMDNLVKGSSSMPSFFIQYKKYISIVGVALALIAVYFFAKTDSKTNELDNPPTKQLPLVEAAANPSSEVNTKQQQQVTPEQITSTAVIVDVKGAVKKPGIYSLDPNARVKDAIDEAGGYIANADSKLINHATKLQDEMVIYVTKKGEKMPEQFEQSPQNIQSNPTTKTPATAANTGAATTDQPLVNLNTADETELQTLSGIGPAKSAAIIAYRTEVGNYETIEDLKKVSGFGEKTFERLQPSITVQ